jgi:hypothetical protein
MGANNANDHIVAMRELVKQNERLLEASQQIISDLNRRVPDLRTEILSGSNSKRGKRKERSSEP